ncbi:hypothetical protein [Tunturiibacter gelidiferens]|uniref:hypothetical protein n=1 Tax=Tunturiibacter gelidiferens TaxID=3069689 RepID=UPI003D9BEE2A
MKNRAGGLILRLFWWLTCGYRTDSAVESRTPGIATVPEAIHSVNRTDGLAGVQRLHHGLLRECKISQNECSKL